MFQTKCAEEIKTHVVFSNLISENRSVYEIMWKNFVEPDRPQMTVRRKPIALWITKAANTHSEYVIIFAFLRKE
jgi:hypothetical protein